MAPASDPSVKKPRAPKTKVVKPPSQPSGGLWFAPASPAKGSPEAKAAAKAAPPKPKREKLKNDPKVVEAARELRDRYIEEINAAPHLLLPPSANGKYDVSRQLEAGGAPSFGG